MNPILPSDSPEPPPDLSQILVHLRERKEMTWAVWGACNDHDPETFYPEQGGPVTEAKRICWEECPARLECLEYALENKEPFGVWGGYSVRERRAILRGERGIE